ncbi:hypothetical protein B0T16DRAFT_333567 [Cercophora newfieldiana]|uniref:Uncharacterized protein n=1 Tax=Cercophora newfieldiana TaxID=92897 RepID=A0AA39Y1S1_9PEZI|nr:hypothetical protein B0T16DRAFT_333567 [Cercophora newfieldiana]
MSEEELGESSRSPHPDIHQQETHALPPYSGPYSGPSSSSQEPASAPTPKGPQRYPGLPALDYRLYSPPLFELSADSTTIRSTAPYLSANASALVDLVRAQSTVPPKPQLHITGKRNSKVDFAIKLNLMSLLVPDDPRQRMDYIRCVGDGELAFRGGAKPSLEPNADSVEEWVRRYIEDPSTVKTFTLERVVANLDINWLEGQIRSMIASIGYKGNVTVSFPITHARVTVQNPDRLNKFFTGVTAFFSGKRKYEVVKAVWPFATNKPGEAGRRCVVQSEETWWREWSVPIKYAVANKRVGWVTNEDKLEAIMEGRGKHELVIDWGPDYQC